MTATAHRWLAPDLAASEGFAQALAAVIAPGVLTLKGELGAGKTTLARALLRGLGYQGRVKSPTYTLIERYPNARFPVVHMDLYRIADPDELDALGFRELDPSLELVLIEWPERAKTVLPAVDMELDIQLAGQGRVIGAQPISARGQRWLDELCLPANLVGIDAS